MKGGAFHLSKPARAIIGTCLFLGLAALGTWQILEGTISQDESRRGAWFGAAIGWLIDHVGVTGALVVHSAFWALMITWALRSIYRPDRQESR